MTTYHYSIPAALALVAKLLILYFSQAAKVQNVQTRLFRMAVLFSILLSVSELIVLQKPFANSSYYGGIAYYAFSIPMFALLTHLAISIGFENFHARRFLPFRIAFYGYVLFLEALLLFTPWIVSGAKDFNGYSATRVPGPLIGLYDWFMIANCLALVFVPIRGLKHHGPGVARSRCQLWLAGSIPLGLLFIAVIVLLNLRVQWFNATVTAPLLIAALLVASGYAVHNHRIVELGFYLPWSKTRKAKCAFYSRIAILGQEISKLPSVETLIQRLADILSCPVVLVGDSLPVSAIVGLDKTITGFPPTELGGINRFLVADEIRDSYPRIHSLMLKHRVAAVVPFFPHSSMASCWLLLGEPFSRRIYSNRDFKAVEELFDKMSGLFLDKLLELGARLETSRARTAEFENKYPLIQKQLQDTVRSAHVSPQDETHPTKTLQDSVAEFEAALIAQALQLSKGNQAEAARLLGLRPNTLHYKMERYELTKSGAKNRDKH
ncbi:MAG TPA: helix-turn-helix domain-containing protein [Burkholderiales bacterium]|nr:helix-turn-helix domain-containing protein [Burkholderiales bacterium]